MTEKHENNCHANWNPIAPILDMANMRDAANMVVASQLFKDPLRKEVFCILYSIMRQVDDLVDSIAEFPEISDLHRTQIGNELTRWQSMIEECYSNKTLDDSRWESVRHHLHRFQIPQTLWINFFDSMWMDFHGLSIETWDDFMKYSEGASVAATTIYLILIGAKQSDSGYDLSEFDFFEAGRCLGIWAYTIHIARDLKEDVLTGNHGRQLVPGTILGQFGLDLQKIRRLASEGRFDKDIGKAVIHFLDLGNRFGDMGKLRAAELARSIPLDRKKILCLIVAMYHLAGQRIRAVAGDVFDVKHKVMPEERIGLVKKVQMSESWDDLSVLWQ